MHLIQRAQVQSLLGNCDPHAVWLAKNKRVKFVIFVNYVSWMVFKKFISKFPLFQFSRSVVSKSLQRHGLQQTKLPCPSLSPGVCSNSCPLSWWCHWTISSFFTSYSPCPQSCPASGSFPALDISLPKYWSLSFSISPSNEYSGFISFRLTGLILLDPVDQGTLKSLLQHHNSKPSVLWCSNFFMVQLLHVYMTTGKKP